VQLSQDVFTEEDINLFPFEKPKTEKILSTSSLQRGQTGFFSLEERMRTSNL